MLHQFMLREVQSKQNINIRELTRTYPSSLFFHYDSVGKLIYKNGNVFDVSNDEVELRDIMGGYKTSRNLRFLNQVSARIQGEIYVDMEDCRPLVSPYYVEGGINIFQYNRLQTDSLAVLWRLPAYYDPATKMGHVSAESINDTLDFREKIPKVFWRGAASGSRWISPAKRVGMGTFSNMRQLVEASKNYSRANAALLSLEFPDVLDLKFTSQKGKPEGAIEFIYSDSIRPVEMLNYKYLLCPNGNDVSTQLYWVVSTNSLALRESSEHEVIPDYFLKPWVHYVPIERGLGDLIEKYEFCERNQSLCEKIIDNAKLAYQEMTDESIWLSAEETVLDRLGLLPG